VIDADDPQYWFKPIRWAKYRGKHVACGACISDLHHGYREERPGGAVQKRTSGQGPTRHDLWLCYVHVREFKDRQIDARSAA